jgi:hypothetical protein
MANNFAPAFPAPEVLDRSITFSTIPSLSCESNDFTRSISKYKKSSKAAIDPSYRFVLCQRVPSLFITSALQTAKVSIGGPMYSVMKPISS